MFHRPRFPAARKSKKSKAPARGKRAEGELETALKRVNGCSFQWDFNPLGTTPKEKLPGDRIATVQGLSIIFDAKEVTLPRQSFSHVRYEPIQRLSAYRNINSGGAGMLFIQHLTTDSLGRCMPEKTRAFLTSYQAFEAIRSASKAKSVNLSDAKRPPLLVEVFKKKFSDHVETWDLEPAIREVVLSASILPNPCPRDVEE